MSAMRALESDLEWFGGVVEGLGKKRKITGVSYYQKKRNSHNK